ncbi:hypothetical protein [Synechococcus sp. MU1655]|uniref:hypothetical protein n=1 Tax=Synechococcus sp. MU1655 TaxID=2508355 RepID=UPI0020263B49|nr:hypothetical protein [Synechococcus sp. MU1655]
MLRSVDSLRTELSGPLTSRMGPKAKILTAEVHGDEVRGLALCPGKVIRYVFAAQTQQLHTQALLSLTTSTRKPAA